MENGITSSSIVVRETAISMAINAVLSILFFLAVFGVSRPVSAVAFGSDFLAQAFMVALMGALVPGLLTAKRSGAARGPVVRRAILLAFAGLVVAGGGAYAACVVLGESTIAPGIALVVKAGFGALLAAIVTPIAVRAALRPSRPPAA